jgi:hypothetical protein
MSTNSLHLKDRKLSAFAEGGDGEVDGSSTAEHLLPGQPDVKEFSAFTSAGLSFSHLRAKFRPRQSSNLFTSLWFDPLT